MPRRSFELSSSHAYEGGYEWSVDEWEAGEESSKIPQNLGESSLYDESWSSLQIRVVRNGGRRLGYLEFG
jgi:hypothetical protein